MSTIAMSGSDTLKINNRLLADVADGDWGKLTFPNDIAAVKTGKNGNSIYGDNQTGKQGELEIRIIRGSSDDKFLANLMANQRNNFAGFVLMNGELIKRVGDGQGNLAQDTYLSSGGIFSKNIEAVSNAEGSTDQSVSVYHVKFSNVVRIIA